MLRRFFGSSNHDAPTSTLTIKCPFSIKLVISFQTLYDLRESLGGNIRTEISDASNIPGCRYLLVLLPNGDSDERRGQALLSLSVCPGKNLKVLSEATFSVDSAGFCQTINGEYESSKTSSLGLKICDTPALFGPEFIVNGKLTVECRGTLKVERETTPDKWENDSFLGHLWKQDDKDFTILVDGKSIQAHKNVLIARSPVFEGMFNSGMRESLEMQMKIIDADYETVQTALDLMYDRKPSTLTLDEKMKVLKFFDKYDVRILKESLEDSLAENISSATVCRIAKFSTAMNFEKLHKRCHDFMVASVRCNRMIDDFLGLDDYFSTMILKKVFYEVTVVR